MNLHTNENWIPVNTSSGMFSSEYAISLKLITELDLRKSGIAQFWAKHSVTHNISQVQPFSLTPRKLILAKTLETVHFPLNDSGICFSARVEGRSSLARCGILVHFTAPTIHAGFE